MRDVRVALAQISPRLGDLEANLALHEEAVRRARAEGAEVVVFPELSLTGYLLRDQVPEVAIREGDDLFRRLAALSASIDVVAGFVEEAPGHRYHNSGAHFSAGALVHLHRKIYLPTYGMFQEGRDLAAGERIRAYEAPFGPAGMLVCEDLWHSASSWLLAQQGAETIFVLSNGPTRGTRPGSKVTSIGLWRGLLEVTARFQTSYMIYVNRVGCEDGISFGGGSLAVDPFGRPLAELPVLDQGLAVVELSAEVLRRARTDYPLLRDEKLELVAREIDRLRRLRYDLPDERPAARARRAKGRR